MTLFDMVDLVCSRGMLNDDHICTRKIELGDDFNSLLGS